MSSKKTLRISFFTDPPTLDPRKTGSFVDSTLSFMLFSGLSRVLPNQEVGPSIAKDYKISTDQKTYTFYLRDAKWSDGHPITAHDFEESWKKIIDPTFPSLTKKLFYCIKNAEKAATENLSLDEVSIQALDNKTLKIELDYPTPYFLELTAFCAFFPAPSHIVEKQNLDTTTPSDLVCSGPFKISKWTPKKEIWLEKNLNYWDAPHVPIDQLQIQIIEDSSTALQMFEEGELDFLGSAISPISYSAAATLDRQEKLKKTVIPGSCFLSFNTESFPFHSLSIRKALSYAIDRKELVSSITLNYQVRAKKIIPPPFEKNEDTYLLPDNDLEKAKKYLQKGLNELNLSRTELKIALQTPNTPIEKMIAKAIQRQVEDRLGILLEIEEYPYSIHIDRLRSHKHQLAIAEWIFQYNDVMNIFSRFRQKNAPVNYSQWENLEFISFLDFAKQTTDKNQYYEILNQAEKLLLKDLPISPLYHYHYLTAQQKGVEPIVIGKSGDLHFEFTNKGSI